MRLTPVFVFNAFQLYWGVLTLLAVALQPEAPDAVVRAWPAPLPFPGNTCTGLKSVGKDCGRKRTRSPSSSRGSRDGSQSPTAQSNSGRLVPKSNSGSGSPKTSPKSSSNALDENIKRNAKLVNPYGDLAAFEVSKNILHVPAIGTFKLVNVPADGNCFFHATGKQVGKSSSELKNQLLDFVQSPEFEQGQTINGVDLTLLHSKKDEIVEILKAKNRYGGSEFDSMVAAIYNRPFITLQPGTKSTTVVLSGSIFGDNQVLLEGKAKPIYLYLAKKHYWILQPQNNPTK